MGGPTGSEILGIVAELSSDPRTGAERIRMKRCSPVPAAVAGCAPIIQYGSLRTMKTRHSERVDLAIVLAAVRPTRHHGGQCEGDQARPGLHLGGRLHRRRRHPRPRRQVRPHHLGWSNHNTGQVGDGAACGNTCTTAGAVYGWGRNGKGSWATAPHPWPTTPTR